MDSLTGINDEDDHDDLDFKTPLLDEFIENELARRAENFKKLDPFLEQYAKWYKKLLSKQCDPNKVHEPDAKVTFNRLINFLYEAGNFEVAAFLRNYFEVSPEDFCYHVQTRMDNVAKGLSLEEIQASPELNIEYKALEALRHFMLIRIKGWQ